MNEIKNNSGDKISKQQLEEIFPDKVILLDRLFDMKNNRFIIEENNVIILQRKGKIYSNIILIFRKLFGIKTYG